MAEDTIVAAATAPGAGLRAVVRLSGPRAIEFARGRPGAVLLPAPRTYTGEDSAEIHLPGSPPLVRALLDDLVRSGARPAQPGEFTLRAFLSGRLDLARAEAVERLVAAEGEAARRAAAGSLAGAFSRRVARMEHPLLDLCADVEASIDFADQDLDLLPAAEARRRCGEILAALRSLLRECGTGRIPSGRPRVVLYGPPNAGKSSLFNALTGSAAITSPAAGTTRDVLEAEADLGVPVLLADTAGDREASGVEAEAVGRSRAELEGADLVLLVSGPDTREAARRLEPRAADPLRVLTKADLGGACWEGAVRVSSRTGEGMGDLRREVGRRLSSGAGPGARIETSLRQRALLGDAGEALERADSAFREGAEFAAADLRAALSALGAITGREVDEALLDRIFFRFCLGK